MFKYPYLLLKQHLSSRVPELKEIDWYKGQDRKNNKGVLKISPGAYFRFLPCETKSLGNGIQSADVEFELILLQDNLYDDDKRINPTTGTDHLSLVDKIHKALSGHSDWVSSLAPFASLKNTPQDWKPFNTIDRINIDPTSDDGPIMTTVQTFKFFAKDYSGNKEWLDIVTPITLNIEDFEI